MAINKKLAISNVLCTLGGGLFAFWLLGGFGRGPADVKPVAAKGDYVVVFVDDSSPSIPQGIILDGPQFDALKLAGMCAIVPITDPIMAEGDHNYGDLLKECGGAPGMAILDKKTGGLAKATRLPTDTRTLDTLLKAHVVGLPPPLPEAMAAPVVSAGGDLKVFSDGAIGPNGRYKLGANPSTPAMRAGLPRYGASNPIFPESAWRPINRRNMFGSQDWILNQGDISSCVGNGWAGALRRARVLAGMKDVKLSPGFFYSLINGNRDEGAVISNGIQAACKVGTCPFDIVGQKPFYQRQMPPEAKAEAARFKACECFQCNTWEEVCSALQTGRYTLTFGIMVGNNWTHFDKYGVCGHDKGPGNHCVAADGMVKLPDGRWVLDAYNSWGYETFGPFKNGRMYLDKQHLFGGGDMPDVCVIRVPGRDPQDPYAPPPYRHKAGDAQFGIAH